MTGKAIKRWVRNLLLIISSTIVTACGTVTQSPPSPPAVNSTTPTASETGVPLNRAIAVTFNKQMDVSTVNVNTFTLRSGAGAVSGTVSMSGTTALFRPSANLLPNTSYTATVTTGIRDITGAPPVALFAWTFTTGNAVDSAPPSLILTVPANNSTGIGANTAITVTFSEPMDPATITGTTLFVNGPSGVLSGTVTLNGAIATFTPLVQLSFNNTYTATITGSAKDLAGNALVGSTSWSFATGTTLSPAVISTLPANGATNVARTGTVVAATFSKAMNPASITPTTFTLTFGGVPVNGSAALNAAGTTATFTSVGALQASTTYTATITTGAQDTGGIPLSGNSSWSFTTGAL